MHQKLIEQIVHALTADGAYRGSEWLVSSVVEDTLQWLQETQIVTYTFNDPEGANGIYPDLDDLVLDLYVWEDENPGPWPVYQQIEFREPTHVITFDQGVAVLQ